MSEPVSAGPESVSFCNHSSRGSLKYDFSSMTILWLLLAGLSVVSARPAVEAPSASSHSFIWKGSTGTLLDQALRSNLDPGDFFYLFSGDTQHFYPCENINTGCLAKTPECRHPMTPQCIEKQSEWSNRYQQVSMRKLVEVLSSSTGQLPKALVLNGDLIQLGTTKEVDTYKGLWENFDERFPMYPGLGNHDYANNIDQCDKNNCTHRILSRFTDYVQEKLGRPMDMRNETADPGRVITGSLAYSWDQCQSTSSGNTCFHFVQQNNYPTYSRDIAADGTTWKITSSLTWLQNDLKDKAGAPTVLNLHDFDTMFNDEAKREFQKVLRESKANVIAVFFAHMHHKVGLRSHWCLGNQTRPVWNIYSGSVPGNNYVLTQFSTTEKGLKTLYKIHVVNETTSAIEVEPLSATCPAAG